jgi:hypothetical protein
MRSVRRQVFASIVVTGALVAGCSSSHQSSSSAHASATTMALATGRESSTTASPPTSKTDSCPPSFPRQPLFTLNAGIDGRENALVPFVATAARLCRYDIVKVTPSRTKWRLVGAGLLSGPSARRLAALGNALPLATRGTCRSARPQFIVLTFANHATRVHVEEEVDGPGCNIGPTNGIWGGGASTTTWRRELLRNT